MWQWFIWHKLNLFIIISLLTVHVFIGIIFHWIVRFIIIDLECCVSSDFKFISKSIHIWPYLWMANMNRLETFYCIFSLLLSCQNTLSSPIPTPLLFVLQKWIVYLPLDSHISLLVFEEWVDTPIWLEMSVITYLITLLSYLRIAHCSANLSGHLCVFLHDLSQFPSMPVPLCCLKNYLLIQTSACCVAF